MPTRTERIDRDKTPPVKSFKIFEIFNVERAAPINSVRLSTSVRKITKIPI